MAFPLTEHNPSLSSLHTFHRQHNTFYSTCTFHLATEMAVHQKFPDVHWLWKGGISFVYEVHPRIVVKVPKSGDLEKEQFRKELRIQEIFSRSSPCPPIVQCFFFTSNGIFLEYMRGAAPITAG